MDVLGDLGRDLTGQVGVDAGDQRGRNNGSPDTDACASSTTTISGQARRKSSTRRWLLMKSRLTTVKGYASNTLIVFGRSRSSHEAVTGVAVIENLVSRSAVHWSTRCGGHRIENRSISPRSIYSRRMRPASIVLSTETARPPSGNR